MTPKNFRHWRKSLGLSQKEAAQALGLKRRVVQYYEKGERDGSSIEIPRYIRLACYSLAQGVTDYHGTPDSLSIDPELGEPAGEIQSNDIAASHGTQGSVQPSAEPKDKAASATDAKAQNAKSPKPKGKANAGPPAEDRSAASAVAEATVPAADDVQGSETKAGGRKSGRARKSGDVKKANGSSAAAKGATSSKARKSARRAGPATGDETPG